MKPSGTGWDLLWAERFLRMRRRLYGTNPGTGDKGTGDRSSGGRILKKSGSWQNRRNDPFWTESVRRYNLEDILWKIFRCAIGHRERAREKIVVLPDQKNIQVLTFPGSRSIIWKNYIDQTCVRVDFGPLLSCVRENMPARTFFPV